MLRHRERVTTVQPVVPTSTTEAPFRIEHYSPAPDSEGVVYERTYAPGGQVVQEKFTPNAEGLSQIINYSPAPTGLTLIPIEPSRHRHGLGYKHPIQILPVPPNRPETSPRRRRPHQLFTSGRIGL